MKVAIMQPYLFPYIGYWQLINSVDRFVILDDVNYIKKGWINRNRILINGEERNFVLPLVKPSQNRKINDIDIYENMNSKEELLKKFKMSYKKSTEYENFINVLEKIVLCDEIKISNYIENSIRTLCAELDINTEILVSSKIHKDNNLVAQERIIEICKRIGGDFYINSIGGRMLYNSETFKENGIELKFLKTDVIDYELRGRQYLGLSIIDVLFWNEKDKIKEYLNKYLLIN